MEEETDTMNNKSSGQTNGEEVTMYIVKQSESLPWKEAHFELNTTATKIQYQYSYTVKERTGFWRSKFVNRKEKEKRITENTHVIDVFDERNNGKGTEGRLYYIDNYILSSTGDLKAAFDNCNTVLFGGRENTESAHAFSIKTFLKWLSSKSPSQYNVVIGLLLGLTIMECAKNQEINLEHELKELQEDKAKRILEVFCTVEKLDIVFQKHVMSLAIFLIKRIGGNWFDVLYYFYSTLSVQTLISLWNTDFEHQSYTGWSKNASIAVSSLTSDFKKDPMKRDLKDLLIFVVQERVPLEALLNDIIPVFYDDTLAAPTQYMLDVDLSIQERLDRFMQCYRAEDLVKFYFVWSVCRKFSSLSDIIHRNLFKCIKLWNGECFNLKQLQTIKVLVSDINLYKNSVDMVFILTACSRNYLNGGSDILVRLLQLRELYGKLLEADILSYIHVLFIRKPVPISDIVKLVTDSGSDTNSGPRLLEICLERNNEGGHAVLTDILKEKSFVKSLYEANMVSIVRECSQNSLNGGSDILVYLLQFRELYGKLLEADILSYIHILFTRKPVPIYDFVRLVTDSRSHPNSGSRLLEICLDGKNEGGTDVLMGILKEESFVTSLYKADMVSILKLCSQNSTNGGSDILLYLLRFQKLYGKLLEADILSYIHILFTRKPVPISDIVKLVTDSTSHPNSGTRLLEICLQWSNCGGTDVLMDILQETSFVTSLYEADMAAVLKACSEHSKNGGSDILVYFLQFQELYGKLLEADILSHIHILFTRKPVPISDIVRLVTNSGFPHSGLRLLEICIDRNNEGGVDALTDILKEKAFITCLYDTGVLKNALQILKTDEQNRTRYLLILWHTNVVQISSTDLELDKIEPEEVLSLIKKCNVVESKLQEGIVDFIISSPSFTPDKAMEYVSFLKGHNDVLCVDSLSMSKLYDYLLFKPWMESISLQDPGIDSTTVSNLCIDASLFITTFSSTGTHAEHLKQNSKCLKIVMALLEAIMSRVQEKRINRIILSHVKTHKAVLGKLFSVIFPTHPPHFAKWTKAVYDASQCESIFRQDITNVNKSLDILGLFEDITQIAQVESVRESIEEKRKSYEQGIVELIETVQSAFWGNEEQIKRMCTDIFWASARTPVTLFESQIFLNIARDVLKKKAKEVSGSITVNDCLNVLADECMKSYESVCKALAKNRLDLVTVAMGRIAFQNNVDQVLNEIKAIRGVRSNTFKILAEIFSNFDKHADHFMSIKHVLAVFKVTDSTEIVQNSVQKLLDILNDDTRAGTSINKFYQSWNQVARIYLRYTDNDWKLVEILATSEKLVSFLKPIEINLKEVLYDAYEESSDSGENDYNDVISSLFDVQDFMTPLFTTTREPNLYKTSKWGKAESLLIKLREGNTSKIHGNIRTKIEMCMNSLDMVKDLFNNLADNFEERVYSAVRSANNESSKYTFKLNAKKEICSIFLTMKGPSSSIVKDYEQLNNFRSRALLLSNSQEKAIHHTVHKGKEIGDMRTFIETVDEVNDIIALADQLIEYGHFSYREVAWESTAPHLHKIKVKMADDVDEWWRILKKARGDFYLLNFVHSKQLYTLYRRFFYTDHLFEDEDVMLTFITPSIKPPRLRLKQTSHEHDIRVIGKALRKLSDPDADMLSHWRYFKSPGGHYSNDSEVAVQSGKIYYAELDADSQSSVHVMMELYRNTTKKYPLPSNVVFCHRSTSFEELLLLLNRCIGLGAKGREVNFSSELHCILNPELLSPEVQYELMSHLVGLRDICNDFLLAVVFRTESNNFIVDQLMTEDTQKLHGLNDKEMEECFQSDSIVCMITSDEPGQGKTEYVRSKASDLKRHYKHLIIDGPITKDEIIQKMLKSKILENSLLHVNVCTMSDPDMFDSFLFELIVMGIAKSGTLMCGLPAGTAVYLEVQNTINDELRKKLILGSHFKRVHLKWENFDNFIVSQEPCSPDQVVCSYYKALQNSDIDDTDLEFHGQNRVPTIGIKECRQLLRQLFTDLSIECSSFLVVNNFLYLAAEELRRLSVSTYFKTANLAFMMGKGDKKVRSTITRALFNIARQYSTSCIGESKSRINHPKSDVTEMVDRVAKMTKWSDTNQLLILFHRKDAQTATPFYRDINLVRKENRDVCTLFESQSHVLDDFSTMEPHKLQSYLEKVCRTTKTPFDSKKLGKLKDTYVLTSDNLLKMLLIHMRTSSRIPVVIMGDTGCGKTSLITYLACVREVELKTYNIHAGRAEKEIVNFFKEVLSSSTATKEMKEIWVFFDEINTSEHLELLNDIICHRMFLGTSLPSNLVFLAACNPYVLKTGEVKTAGGLEGKIHTDEMSKLVYRVHPLPESMIPYVWDFGSLSEAQEAKYIEKMVKTHNAFEWPLLFVELLRQSQRFIRAAEGRAHIVSLRDVDRCIRLAKWFPEMIKESKLATGGLMKRIGRLVGAQETRAMLLALIHCYHSRFTSAGVRRRYREVLAIGLSQHLQKTCKEQDIAKFVEEEQTRLLDMMDLPPGIAKNEALRENVFVTVVCILNKIPVFVVGNPGSSKSLSMQLIRNNLQGMNSKSEFFTKYPQLHPFIYQGTKNSTSAGIGKVFANAQKLYEKQRTEVEEGTRDTVDLPLVLLDEVGLAETSPFNPLKVLYSLLEPPHVGNLDVAVVGLSNWALDAAKMNRAIYLCRPEPTETSLHVTAQSIYNAAATGIKEGVQNKMIKKILQSLVQGYREYLTSQQHENFHGLRDFYALVKYVAGIRSNEKTTLLNNVHVGLQRNFGGLSEGETNFVVETFAKHLKIPEFNQSRKNVLDLIQCNLTDKNNRHLMLITRGNSALSVLYRQILAGKKYAVQIGSRFEDDDSEEYCYDVLSDITLYMEQGCMLILKHMDPIYGSLYDMLNQSYTVIRKNGNTKNLCRIALGADSNPLFQVHDEFRCIVLLEVDDIVNTDPPFLNRFEKQMLTFSDILTKQQHTIVENLTRWVVAYSKVANIDVTKEANFLGLGYDTLPSLVWLHMAQDDHAERQSEIELACKLHLLRIATPDGVLRARRSEVGNEVLRLQEKYFALPHHGGLKHYLQTLITDDNQQQHFTGADTASKMIKKFIIYTRSTIHTNIRELLKRTFQTHVSKLGQFKSTRQLEKEIKTFLGDRKQELFVLQCSGKEDLKHIELAKCKFDEYLQRYYGEDESKKGKYVCVLIHVDRKHKGSKTFEANFLGKWCIAAVDSLEPYDSPLQDMLATSNDDILKTDILDAEELLKNEIQWCFSCMKYEQKQTNRSRAQVLEICKKISENDQLMKILLDNVLKVVLSTESSGVKDSGESWLVNVACNIELVGTYGTLMGAAKVYVRKMLRMPLVKLVLLMEENGIWNSLINPTIPAEDLLPYIRKNLPLLMEMALRLPDPSGKESYGINGKVLDFNYPFFSLIHDKLSRQCERAFILHGDEDEDDFEAVVTTTLLKEIPLVTGNLLNAELLSKHRTLYFSDLCSVLSDQLIHRDGFIEATTILLRHILEIEQPPTSTPDENEVIRALAHWYIGVHLHSDSIGAQLHLMSNYCSIKRECLDTSELLQLGSAPKTSEQQVAKRLVDKVCQSFIQNQNRLLDSNVQNWVSNANTLLSAASQVNNEAHSFHFLRLCTDIAYRLILPGRVNVATLVKVLGHYQDNILGSKVFNDAIMQLCETELDEGGRNLLRSLYFGRCLDAYHQSTHRSPVLETIISGIATASGLRHGARSLLVRLLSELEVNEVDENDKWRLLVKHGLDKLTEKSESLTTLERSLKGQAALDSPLTCACSDIVESLVFSSLFFEDMHEDDNLVTTAMRQIRSAEQSSLQFVCSVAFIRAYFTKYCQYIRKNDSSMKNKLVHKSVLSRFAGEQKMRTTATQLYFLKRFCRTSCMNDTFRMWKRLKERTKDSSFTVENLKWSNGTNSSVLRYNPMRYAEGYQKFHSEFVQSSRMNTTGHRSEEEMFSILAIVSDVCYLSQTLHQRNDIIKESGKQLSQAAAAATSFHPKYNKLLDKLLGVEEFQHDMFKLGTATPKEVVDRVSVFIHIASILLSSCPPQVQEVQGWGTTLASYFFKFQEASPPESQSVCPLCEFRNAIVLPKTVSVLESCLGLSEVAIYHCKHAKCGYKAMIPANVAHRKQKLDCGHRLDCVSKLHQSHPQRPNTYSIDQFCSSTGTCRRDCVRQGTQRLSPAAYRILHLLKSGCCLVCLACDGTCPGTESQTLLHVKRIANDWHALQNILRCTSEETALFVHNVIYKARNLLIDVKVTTHDTASFEEQFASIVDDCTIADERVRFKHLAVDELDGGKQKADSMWLKLMELDQNTTLSRLFQHTRDVSFSDFEADFIGQPKTTRQQFPFIVLFLKMYRALEYVKHLFTISEWAFRCSSACNRKLTSKEAKTLRLSDYLDSERFVSPLEKKNEKEAFEGFKTAWNNITDNWEEITGQIKPKNFDAMNLSKPMVTCLLYRLDSSSQIQQMIQTLVQVQNEFLETCMNIAVTDRSRQALSFLMSGIDNVAKLLMKGLHEEVINPPRGKKSEIIIAFDEKNDDMEFIQYMCDVESEYGRGDVVHYDFLAIEKELARRYVYGKALLDHTSMLVFSYKGELFHSCSTILQDISTRIEQEDVPHAIINSLHQEQEIKTMFACNALEHMELILWLLKDDIGINHEMSIKTYLKLQRNNLLSIPETFLQEIDNSGDLCLKHVVALYEELEFMHSPITKDSLDRELYCKKKSNHESMSKKVEEMTLTRLKSVFKYISKFMVRYLHADVNTNDTDSKMQLLDLMNIVGGTFSDVTNFLRTEDVKVENLEQLLTIMEEKIKEKEDKASETFKKKRKPKWTGKKTKFLT